MHTPSHLIDHGSTSVEQSHLSNRPLGVSTLSTPQQPPLAIDSHCFNCTQLSTEALSILGLDHNHPLQLNHRMRRLTSGSRLYQRTVVHTRVDDVTAGNRAKISRAPGRWTQSRPGFSSAVTQSPANHSTSSLS